VKEYLSRLLKEYLTHFSEFWARQTCSGKIVIASLGFILFSFFSCCTVSWIGARLSSTPTPEAEIAADEPAGEGTAPLESTATNQPTASPSATPTPTVTATATATSKPTATATATETPKPTATATAAATSEPTSIATVESIEVPPEEPPPPIAVPEEITEPPPAPPPPPIGEGCPYIGNSNTNKFHHAGCRHIKQMNEEHKVCLTSREEAIGQGFVPCKVCNP
jgi:hypothetical protein